MRKDIFLAVPAAGLLFFGASAVLLALTDPSLAHWYIVFWVGVICAPLGLINLLILLVWEFSDPDLREKRPKVGPILLINLGTCLLVLGVVWHFSPSDEEQGANETQITPFLVEFPKEANNAMPLSSSSLYGTIVNIGVGGDLMSNFVSKHSFFFKVTNKREMTARSVDVFAINVAYKNGISTAIRVPLPRALPVNPSSTINPGDGAFFGLLEYLDEQANGLLVQHVDAQTSANLRFLARRGWIVPLPHGAAAFAIPVLGGYGVQKPVGDTAVCVDVAIYAEDVKLTYARFAIRGPEPATVHLIAQGLSLPDLNFD
jgi:hypothetical protein